MVTGDPEDTMRDLRQDCIRDMAEFAADIFQCDPDLLLVEAEIAHDEMMAFTFRAEYPAKPEGDFLPQGDVPDG